MERVTLYLSEEQLAHLKGLAGDQPLSSTIRDLLPAPEEKVSAPVVERFYVRSDGKNILVRMTAAAVEGVRHALTNGYLRNGDAHQFKPGKIAAIARLHYDGSFEGTLYTAKLAVEYLQGKGVV